MDYNFVSDELFDQYESDGTIWESVRTYGSYRYGSPRDLLEDAISDPIVAEMEPSGFKYAIERSKRRVVGIFILPPSVDELAQRLASRATDLDIRERLEVGRVQIAEAHHYAYCVTNRDLADFLVDLERILAVEMQRDQGMQDLATLEESFHLATNAQGC